MPFKVAYFTEMDITQKTTIDCALVFTKVCFVCFANLTTRRWHAIIFMIFNCDASVVRSNINWFHFWFIFACSEITWAVFLREVGNQIGKMFLAVVVCLLIHKVCKHLWLQLKGKTQTSNAMVCNCASKLNIYLLHCQNNQSIYTDLHKSRQRMADLCVRISNRFGKEQMQLLLDQLQWKWISQALCQTRHNKLGIYHFHLEKSCVIREAFWWEHF